MWIFCYDFRTSYIVFFDGVKVFSVFHGLTCVASVSVGFGSKERPRNGIFGVLPNPTETLATQAIHGYTVLIFRRDVT